MPLVAAVVLEPDQASTVSSILGALDGLELILSEAAPVLLTRLGTRTPDLVLLSPFIPPSDEALIASALREQGARAAHAQMMTIPLLTPIEPAGGRSSRLFSSFRSAPSNPMSSGCSPEAFLEEVKTYLELASAERRRLDAIAARQSEPPAAEVRAAPEDAA
jgi:hypothetical protein